MRGRAFVVSAVTVGVMATGLLLPSSAQARPAGVVVAIAKVTVSKPTVHVGFTLKGPALVTLVVKSATGYTFVATQSRERTGRSALAWDRSVNGRKAARGTYTLTVVARAGKARSESSSTVDLD
jgi:hypothetical protein